MIKIKNYIFNENEIEYIKSGTTFKENGTALLVETNGLNVKTKKKDLLFEDATFEDIEWNYGTPQETQRQMQKELCKSCYYRDTISNKLKELEEENKRLNFCMKDTYDSANDICSELQQRIDKAIKYLKLKVDIPKNHLEEAIKDREEDLLKILKGEENDNTI